MKRKFIIPWLVVGILVVPHSPGQLYSYHNGVTVTDMSEINRVIVIVITHSFQSNTF